MTSTHTECVKATQYEQEHWSECCRLIANCIIFYNASILSRLLRRKPGRR